jgi:protein-S-isoprenylcysteine O-methyltransferase Ste14
MLNTQSPWWRGSRGEWYVAAQVLLIALVFLGPRTARSLPAWPAPLAQVSIVVGVTLVLAGASLLVAGLLRLGPNLTPVPYPKDKATLVQTGPYRLVRHPMYGGGIVLALGWALAVRGWLTLLYAAVLVGFLEIKVAREERWLTAKFPDYRDYQQRVKKLIPFIH